MLSDFPEQHHGEQELRVWIAGCATGEEAYSVAILLKEHYEQHALPLKAKIFATDVHRKSLEKASLGVYTEAAVAGVSTERLQKYFTRTDSGYQVVPEIRQLVVFAPQQRDQGRALHASRSDLLSQYVDLLEALDSEESGESFPLRFANWGRLVSGAQRESRGFGR